MAGLTVAVGSRPRLFDGGGKRPPTLVAVTFGFVPSGVAAPGFQAAWPRRWLSLGGFRAGVGVGWGWVLGRDGPAAGRAVAVFLGAFVAAVGLTLSGQVEHLLPEVLSDSADGVFEFGQACAPGESLGAVDALDETFSDAVEIIFDGSDAGVGMLGACHPWFLSEVREKVLE